MKPDSPRWTEVTPSRWAHEREGLERYLEPAPDAFGDYTTYCGT